MTETTPIDIQAIKSTANGMLSESVYRRIYELAAAAGAGHMVEVGTAHGAATICLARGLQAGQAAAYRVFSFEKIVGGSREQFGGVDENISIITDNFRRFGVDTCIDLVIGDVSETFGAVPDGAPISFLMLDADGAIDRDFGLFYNRLLPGAPIVIDDCDDRVKLKYLSRDTLRVDLKHKLAFELASLFAGAGILEIEATLGSTWLCRKPAGATTPVDFSSIDVLSVYRRLIFSDAALPSRTRESLYGWLGAHPRVHGTLRKLKRAVSGPRGPRDES